MSIAAKYRFDALRTADTLNHIYQYAQDVVKHLKDTFFNLLRDRNYYVDDDCDDVRVIVDKLLPEKTIEKLFNE